MSELDNLHMLNVTCPVCKTTFVMTKFGDGTWNWLAHQCLANFKTLSMYQDTNGQWMINLDPSKTTTTNDKPRPTNKNAASHNVKPINRNPDQESNSISTTPTNQQNKNAVLNNKKTINWNRDQESDLISLVKEQDDLWDYSKPLSNRSKQHTSDLWDDIVGMMQDRHPELSLTAADVANKWKNMRDYYGRVKRAEKGKTGAAATDDPVLKQWCHVEEMRFLDEVLQPRLTITNLQGPLGDESIAPASKKARGRRGEIGALADAVNQWRTQKKEQENIKDNTPFMNRMAAILNKIDDEDIVEEAIFDVHSIVRKASKKWLQAANPANE